MKRVTTDPKIFGFLAEFEQPEELLAAARNASREGYRKIDAYSPFPIDGLSEAIGFEYNRVAAIVLIGGIIGGLNRFFHAMVFGCDSLPDRCRWPTAQ